MQSIVDWVTSNAGVLFSGIGVFVLSVLYKIFTRRADSSRVSIAQSVTTPITNNFYGNGQTSPAPVLANDEKSSLDKLEVYQEKTRILFVDDDRHFKVVKILQNSGWVHTKLIKDISALNQPELEQSHILFVDIQGVGVSLGFRAEGLGLALAIKERHPKKKVVIYSAQTEGERFHKALQTADASLAKNADPYEFQQLVEGFAKDVISL